MKTPTPNITNDPISNINDEIIKLLTKVKINIITIIALILLNNRFKIGFLSIVI